MARIDNFSDSAQGGVGNLVFYTMHGKKYARSRPAQYTDRKSAGQLAQRQRLQVVTDFLRLFREPLRISFASEATGRSALQAAQSHNMRHALTGEYPDISISPGRAMLSRGPLPLPLSATVSAHADGLFISWENGPQDTLTDNLLVMAWFEGDAWSDYRFTDTARSKGEYIWKMAHPVKPGALPHVWIAFRSVDMGSMSNSMYIS